MEPYIDEFGNLQFKQPANYTGINGINMNQLNIEPYNSMAEMRGQPENRSVLDQGIPFALPNLNYRNYDLSNLFNRNQTTQPDFINAPQDYYQPMAMRKDLEMDTSYGVANEPDVEQDQEYIDQVKKSQNGGIAKLFEFLGNIPTPFNLVRRGLESLSGLNQRLRATDFAQANSLMDYLDMRKYGGLQGRRDAAAATMAQARGLQKQIDQRPTATQTTQDRGRGDRPGGANYSAPSRPSRTSPQSGMQAERTRSRDLGSMRGGVGR